MFARTKRLILRPFWAEDAFALAEAMDDEAVSGQLALRIEGRSGDPRLPDMLAFARTGGAPRLVGGAGLRRRSDDEAELGFWVARPFWGLGFGTEAARAALRIARTTGFSRIVATPGRENGAAARVLGKLGFRHAGYVERRRDDTGQTLRCALFEDGAEPPLRGDMADELYHDRMESIAA